MRRQILQALAALLSLSALGAPLAADEPDLASAMRRFIGEWHGDSTGKPGTGTAARRYAFVLNDRFVHETNLAYYPPQEANKKGETHEHWSMFSFDRARKVIVLRQFHVEGFVDTYHQVSKPASTTLVFESEGVENAGKGWRARETYEFKSNDEFVETFELAPPGKPFEIYSRNRFTRR